MVVVGVDLLSLGLCIIGIWCGVLSNVCYSVLGVF